MTDDGERRTKQGTFVLRREGRGRGGREARNERESQNGQLIKESNIRA
jgi:hypothetical protein